LFAEHHNLYTQRAYHGAVRRFLAWCEGRGRALPQVTPGMVDQYIARLGVTPAKRNLHLSALRGFLDCLAHRHVVLLNPAASVRGVKEQVVEVKTPEITIDQAKRVLKSIKTIYNCDSVEIVSVVGLRDRTILATLANTACRAWAVARLRLQDFQYDGEQYVLRFLENGGKTREIPVRLELQRFILAYLDAAGIQEEAKDSPLLRSTTRKTKQLTGRQCSVQSSIKSRFRSGIVRCCACTRRKILANNLLQD
jgi:site-specific recombinase XerD